MAGSKFGYLSQGAFFRIVGEFRENGAELSSSELSAAYKYAIKNKQTFHFNGVWNTVNAKLRTGAKGADVTKQEANIVLAMAKGGDTTAKDLLKQLPETVQKNSDVYDYLHPTSTAKKVIVGGSLIGGTAVGGGIVLKNVAGAGIGGDSGTASIP